MATDSNIYPGERLDGDAGGEGNKPILIDFVRLWQRVIQYRYWIAAFLVSVIVTAVIITMLQTPYYRSTAQIEINRVDAGASQSAGEGDFVVEERDAQYYNTQYELLQTPSVAERVSDALNLARDPVFNDAFAGSDSEVGEQRIITILLDSVTITPIRNSNLVDIGVSSPDAALSAEIANAWAEQFLEMNYEKRFGDTILARERLEGQLAEMRVQLEQSEAQLNEFASDNEIIVIDTTSEAGESGRSTILANQLEAMSSALADATIRRISAQSALQSRNADRGGQRVSIQQRIAETEAELANLRTTLGPAHPSVLAQEAELRSLRASLDNAGSDAREERQAAYQQALAEEQELRARYEAAKSQYLGQQGRGVGYGILEREVDTNRQIYDALLQRYNELGLVGTGRNNMALVEQARRAPGPYTPSLPRNLAIAFGLGLVGVVGFVYVSDMLDQTVRDPDEVARQFGLRLLGLIPDASDMPIEDALLDKHSALSEAYASARVAMQLLPDETPTKSLMLTSSRPAEGKSVSSVALAKSFAEVGERTVLVDLDLRRRGVSQILSMNPSDIGIARYLSGTAEAPTLRHQEEHGFDFIGSNSNAKNPVTLLSSPKLAVLLRDLAKNYDRIVVDGPPVLGLADAIELSRMVDGVVYVVEANSGTNRAIRLALSRLRGASANIIGGILTKLDERNAAYGYGYGYGYGYAYEPKT
ncbi:GumC family protein [Aurantiacibacter gilvus]|uniref:non-specific protein-tyrosine kinase n=1 Tax=Aurantiacibacter gilvus TaxID=3139141 RepID=A0ABU9IHC3_9SPHN